MTKAEEGAPRRRRRRTAAAPPGDEHADAIAGAATPPAPKTKPKAAAKGSDKIFETAAHQGAFPKPPDMQRGFQTIVKDIFAEGYDVVAEWQAIRAEMVITDALSPDRLRRAANTQEDVSIRAHRLYLVAKVEVSAYMRDTESIFGSIRESAIQELEKQKANKTRTKQITDADAKTEAARLYPDEWADICTRRERAEAMLAQLLRLSEAAKSRCYTVSNMMSPGGRGV